MNRRLILQYGAAMIGSAWGLTSLTACGGGGDEDFVTTPEPPPTNSVEQCVPSAYALGLNPATPALLTTLSQGTIATVLPTVGSIYSTLPPPPDYFDLSDAGMVSRYGWPGAILPRPSNQGELGSCVAWGAGYAMASFLKAVYEYGLSAQTPGELASPADLYAKILRREISNPCGNGTLIRDALDVLVQERVASLATVPYTDRACLAPSTSGEFGIDSYQVLPVTDSVLIKQAISSFNVLPFGMMVYSDFQQLRGPVIYSRSASVECPLGGHCMALVGYDDARGAYRVMNSWGTQWGDGGFGWISYETFDRIVTEVYSPVVVGNMASLLLPLPGTTSGSVVAEAASYGLHRDPASNEFNAGVFRFRLSDAVYASGYELRFIPGSGQPVVVMATREIRQAIRGTVLEIPLSDQILRSAGPGRFALRVTGISRFGESIDLTMQMDYPPPTGR